MAPLAALTYSFLFGLLHGILPDEHTWPITFSYAIGGASGKEGIKAGLYFSSAFTAQRMIISELACLALAPFMASPTLNRTVYIAVGIVMSAAGAIVLRHNRSPHIHLLGHHHEEARKAEMTSEVLGRSHSEPSAPAVMPPPVRWTLIHGFIAGFGFGGFALFVNTVAAPAMPPWLGFMPGLMFGLGTMAVLAVLGGLFGASLRRASSLTEQEIKLIGAQTGGRTLFYGGLLFVAGGAFALARLDRYSPIDTGYALIAIFTVAIALPAFVYSFRSTLALRAKQAKVLPFSVGAE
jgi:hypothetical protein